MPGWHASTGWGSGSLPFHDPHSHLRDLFGPLAGAGDACGDEGGVLSLYRSFGGFSDPSVQSGKKTRHSPRDLVVVGWIDVVPCPLQRV